MFVSHREILKYIHDCVFTAIWKPLIVDAWLPCMYSFSHLFNTVICAMQKQVWFQLLCLLEIWWHTRSLSSGVQGGICTIRLGKFRNRKSLFCLMKGLAKVLGLGSILQYKIMEKQKAIGLPTSFYNLRKLWGAWYHHLTTEFFRLFFRQNLTFERQQNFSDCFPWEGSLNFCPWFWI